VTLSLLCAKSLPAKFGGLPLRPDVPKGSQEVVSCIGGLIALPRPDSTTAVAENYSADRFRCDHEIAVGCGFG